MGSPKRVATSPIKPSSPVKQSTPMDATIPPAASSPVFVAKPAGQPVSVSPVKPATATVPASSPAAKIADSPVKPAVAPVANSSPSVAVEDTKVVEAAADGVAMDTTESEASSAKRKLDDTAEVKQEVKKAKTEHVHVPKIVPEDEPAFDEDALVLDWCRFNNWGLYLRVVLIKLFKAAMFFCR